MAVFFGYLGKNDLSTAHMYSSEHIGKSLFTKYQKNTVMFNFSPLYNLIYNVSSDAILQRKKSTSVKILYDAF